MHVFFIKSLAIYNKKKEPKTVVSPTYNLIQDYDCGKKNIVCHIDLYRLKNIKEIENLGFFEEIEDKIALIEWPEKIEKLIKNRIEIIFFHDLKNFDKRTIVIKTFGNNYMNKLNLLKLIKI